MRYWILPTLTIALDLAIIPSGLPEKVVAKCDHLVNPSLMIPTRGSQVASYERSSVKPLVTWFSFHSTYKLQIKHKL
jgi:hypothetical protein